MKEKLHEYQKMFSVESSHWWYRILHLLVYRIVSRYFSDKRISILDAGCGTGGLMRYLIDKGYPDVQGFDVSEHAVKFSRESGLDVQELDLLGFAEYKMNKEFDVIISNDTLCYFSDPDEQKQVLSNFYNNLTKGGILLMNLPALQQFEGIHDIAVGLKTRFTVEKVSGLVDPKQFELEQINFWPFLLSPLIFIVRKNQRRKIDKGEYSVSSDIDIPFFPINLFLYLLTRLEITVFKKSPFGSSLMVVLKKV